MLGIIGKPDSIVMRRYVGFQSAYKTDQMVGSIHENLSFLYLTISCNKTRRTCESLEALLLCKFESVTLATGGNHLG